MDAKKIQETIEFLRDNPDFDEMPATIEEFLGPEYLNVDDIVRPGLRKALIEIFGENVNALRISNYERAMITGGIGIGKTTFASIAIPYMVHHTLCLRNPQAFYGLMSGSRIAFMQMSTSAKQAVEVIFGDLKARIEHSPWFVDNYQYDPDFTKQMRFPKDIWVLPGASTETSFEGYNILGGILDEMDSHKRTEDKDYADVGFDAIESRISSRFTDFGNPDNEEDTSHRGLLICIGQMKSSNGFAARKYKSMLNDPKAYTMKMTIWESFGWQRFTRSDGTRASFWYNTKTKKIIPSLLVDHVSADHLIEIPNRYKARFENSPEKALRDLAGIPPATSDQFFSQEDRIELAVTRWETRFSQPSPVGANPTTVDLAPWFRADNDPRKRVLHIDFALSQDAMGIAMGHVDHLVTVEEEEKPYIIFDCLIRLKALPGGQIDYGGVRRLLYELRDDRKFKLKKITMDGFQSTDTKQQLMKRHFEIADLSADKSTLPYEDLREAINEYRVEFPRYMTYMSKGDTEQVEIAPQELINLSFDGKKVDHQPDGSKDVADAMACVSSTLMGDRSYRRGLRSDKSEKGNSQFYAEADELSATGTDSSYGNVLSFPGVGGLSAPVPPRTGTMGLTVPQRLKPRR